MRGISIRNTRGALTLVALMLFGSALIRLGAGPATAIALEIDAASERAQKNDPSDITPELVRLLEEAQARTAALDEREVIIEARIRTLRLIEAEVAEEVDRLEAAEVALRDTMAAADAAAESDLERLTAVYENMKPEQASALFQRMAPTFAAGFLGRMRPDAAAAIFAGLDPDLAYQISVVLAGRNADVPREPVPASGQAARAE